MTNTMWEDIQEEIFDIDDNGWILFPGQSSMTDEEIDDFIANTKINFS